jgi:uncharacterized membrane protein YhhN
MPVLLLFYFLNSDQYSVVIILALFLAFLGDFFLMWHKKQWPFLSGLLSFFVMQILYIVFMFGRQIHISNLGFEALVMAVVYLMLGAFIFILLNRFLQNLKIPVIFYILALLSVSYFCLLNVMEHKTEIAFVQYMGSLLFIISDTLLAVDNFRKPIRFAGIFIMLTYIVAQIFLLSGFMNT